MRTRGINADYTTINIITKTIKIPQWQIPEPWAWLRRQIPYLWNSQLDNVGLQIPKGGVGVGWGWEGGGMGVGE